MRISDWSSDVCSSDLARFGRADRCDLVPRHLAAINLDRHRIEQRGVRAPGTQARQIALQRFDRAVHTAFAVGLVIFRPLSFLSYSSQASPPTVATPRSDQRLVGKEFVSSVRFLWSAEK